MEYRSLSFTQEKHACIEEENAMVRSRAISILAWQCSTVLGPVVQGFADRQTLLMWPNIDNSLGRQDKLRYWPLLLFPSPVYWSVYIFSIHCSNFGQFLLACLKFEQCMAHLCLISIASCSADLHWKTMLENVWPNNDCNRLAAFTVTVLWRVAGWKGSSIRVV